MQHRAIAFGQFGVTFGIHAAGVAIINDAVGLERPFFVIDSRVAFGRGPSILAATSVYAAGVLPADRNDRDTTRRLNRAKKLSFQLPPG